MRVAVTASSTKHLVPRSSSQLLQPMTAEELCAVQFLIPETYTLTLSADEAQTLKMDTAQAKRSSKQSRRLQFKYLGEKYRCWRLAEGLRARIACRGSLRVQ